MTKRLRLKQTDLEWVSTSDETVILDDSSEQYFATNSAGSLLWERLKEGATPDSLTDILVATFDIDRPQAESDVNDFVKQLDELNMLERLP